MPPREYEPDFFFFGENYGWQQRWDDMCVCRAVALSHTAEGAFSGPDVIAFVSGFNDDWSILCGEEVDGWGKGGEGRRPEDKGPANWGATGGPWLGLGLWLGLGPWLWLRLWLWIRLWLRPTRLSGAPMHDLRALEWYVTVFYTAGEIKLKGEPFWEDWYRLEESFFFLFLMVWSFMDEAYVWGRSLH